MKTAFGYEHIFVGSGQSAVRLVFENLSDGSKVWNIEFTANQLPCLNEEKGRIAMAKIASALRECSVNDGVLHL